MNSATRIGPLRRFKSERHAALDEHARHFDVDPHAPWRIPAPARHRTERVEPGRAALWLAWFAGFVLGLAMGAMVWR